MRTVLMVAAGAWFAGAAPAFAEGLPQLDPAKFAPQIVWLVITFTVLYFLMSRLALPRISQVLEERQHKIDGDLKKAETLKVEAQAAAEAYEKSMAEARTKAHGILGEASRQMAGEAAERQAELAERLAGEVKEAEAAIAEAKDKALATIADMSIEVGRAAAEKLAGTKIDKGSIAGAVARALEDRR